jgi:hypothetical protein
MLGQKISFPSHSTWLELFQPQIKIIATTILLLRGMIIEIPRPVMEALLGFDKVELFCNPCFKF